MNNYLIKSFFGMDSLFESNCFFMSNFNREDFKSTDSSYDYQLAIPGIDKSDLNIFVEKNKLHVEYKKDEKKGNSIFMDSFAKSFTLPENSDQVNITAKTENGILYVSIPKKETKEKKIEIKVD